MNTKLTLSLDELVIKEAKKYAKSNKVSLSHLIESYLSSLLKNKSKNIEITPLVKSLSGVIDLDVDFDYKKNYADFLNKKYK